MSTEKQDHKGPKMIFTVRMRDVFTKSDVDKLTSEAFDQGIEIGKVLGRDEAIHLRMTTDLPLTSRRVACRHCSTEVEGPLETIDDALLSSGWVHIVGASKDVWECSSCSKEAENNTE
jgi:hypothetical protein